MKSQRIRLALVVVLLVGGPRLTAQQGGTHWVGIWATADTWRPAATAVPSGAPPVIPSPAAPVQFSGQTLRQIVHTTLGGDRLRVVFSNAFGTAPIPVGAAGIALRDK